jgi:hypothetical protein
MILLKFLPRKMLFLTAPYSEEEVKKEIFQME